MLTFGTLGVAALNCRGTTGTSESPTIGDVKGETTSGTVHYSFCFGAQLARHRLCIRESFNSINLINKFIAFKMDCTFNILVWENGC